VALNLPGVTLKNIVYEPLLEVVRQRGGLGDSDAERLQGHIALAESIGAQSVLVTCSTVSPLVDRVRPGARLPVFKIDEAMLDAAVQLGPRIGVLATNPTTLAPTRQLLEERAKAAGYPVEVETQLVPGALDALMGGDGETHDRLLAAAIEEISPRVQAVVLAQASMARVLESLPPSARTKPVLSSPHLALERLQEIYS
jgi:Asp/Glu/hydantoin racemase